MCGSHSHGQSQATTYAQIVADQIGCDIGDVEVVFGDTDRIPFGQGTYGSRSLTVTGSALYLATRSEEHASELQSLMRISYAVFCLKKKNTKISKLHDLKHFSHYQS